MDQLTQRIQGVMGAPPPGMPGMPPGPMVPPPMGMPGMPPRMPGMGGPPGMGPMGMPPGGGPPMGPGMGMPPMGMPGMSGFPGMNPMGMLPPNFELSGNVGQDLLRTAANLLQIATSLQAPASREASVTQGILRDLAGLVGGLSGASEYPIGPSRTGNLPTMDRGAGVVPPDAAMDELI